MNYLDDLMICDCGGRHGLKECPALKTEGCNRHSRPPADCTGESVTIAEIEATFGYDPGDIARLAALGPEDDWGHSDDCECDECNPSEDDQDPWECCLPGRCLVPHFSHRASECYSLEDAEAMGQD